MYKIAVLDHFGTPGAVAKFLGLTSGAVSQWGAVIPERQALKLANVPGFPLNYQPGLYSARGMSAA